MLFGCGGVKRQGVYIKKPGAIYQFLVEQGEYRVGILHHIRRYRAPYGWVSVQSRRERERRGKVLGVKGA